MNPVTIGHIKMAKQMAQLADDNTTAMLYLSHSYDGANSPKFKSAEKCKNPLPYKSKLKYCRDAMPFLTVVESNAISPWEMLHELYEEGVEEVIVFGGEDRFEEYQRMFAYNGKGDPNDAKFFFFDNVGVQNAGARDESSSDVEEQASASLLRKLVIQQNYDEFEKYAGTKTLTEEMFDELQTEMGIE